MNILLVAFGILLAPVMAWTILLGLFALLRQSLGIAVYAAPAPSIMPAPAIAARVPVRA